MRLKLTKPLIVFDLETTGLDLVNDRIIQISYIKVMPSGEELRESFFVNPGRHIPAEVEALTGISDGDVASAKTFKELASTLEATFKGCDFAGYNSNHFDIPMLAEEFLRAGIDFDFSRCRLIDAQTIFHKMERRNLAAAYKFYCGKNLEDAHTAEADTRATYEVLKAQLDMYQDTLQNDISFLSEYSSYSKNVDFAGRIVYDDNGVEVFNFGKYKGMPVAEVLKKDIGYYGWIMNGDFALNTKNVLTKIRLRETGMLK